MNTEKQKEHDETITRICTSNEKPTQENDSVETKVDDERPAKRGRPRKNLVTINSDVNEKAKSYARSSSAKRKRYSDSEANQEQRIQAESFVMKLFDRSLDLSKYTENSALYPICRAWMANQPRNPRGVRSPSPKQRKDNSQEIIKQLKNGEITVLHNMPKPAKTDLPQYLPISKPKNTIMNQNLVELTDQFKNSTKEEFLKQHLRKWKQIKFNWIAHRKSYLKRNDYNFMIINALSKT